MARKLYNFIWVALEERWKAEAHPSALTLLFSLSTLALSAVLLAGFNPASIAPQFVERHTRHDCDQRLVAHAVDAPLHGEHLGTIPVIWGVKELALRKPANLAFAGPDKKTLYVGDNGAPQHVKAFDVADGALRALIAMRKALGMDSSGGAG